MQCPCRDSPGAPDSWVEGGKDIDLADVQPVAGEQGQEHAPGEPSLRLLTMSAWQAEDSVGSEKLVSQVSP